MFLLATSSPINSRQGNFVLSRTDLVERARVGQRFPARPEHLPTDALSKIINDQKEKQTHDLLVAVNPNYLPEDINNLLRLGEINEDLERYCKAIVFCSYLFNTAGKWANGFVIERSQKGPAAPAYYSFSEAEIQSLSINYLDFPLQTIFIGACKKNGRLIYDLGLFPAIAFHIGYLKAGVNLAEKVPVGISITYELKAACAASYASLSAQILFVNLLAKGGAKYRTYLEPAQTLTTAYQELADAYCKLLRPEDAAVMRWFVRQQDSDN